MKVLILPAYFYPEVCSSSQLTEDRYKALADRNVDMLVYAPYPTRGINAEIRKNFSNTSKITMYDGKMSVYHFPLYKEGKNPIFRAIRYFLQCSIQFYYAVFRAKNIDAILIGSTPPIQGLMAGFIGIFRNIPIVYYLQDIFPDSLVGAKLAHRNGLLWKIGRCVENFTYKHVDKIIVVSKDFKQNILNKGVPENKIELIYNWVDEESIIPIEKKDNPLFEKFGISRENFNIVYAGNLGNAQNIDLILNAAEVLHEEKNINFVIFGSGGNELEIKERIINKGLSNISIFPLQPINMISYVYSLGDVCLVSCKKGFGGSAMPSKTWSIMSAGRPVIANFDEGELQQIIEENECGVFTHAEKLDEFVTKIKYLSENKEKCLSMGINARAFVLKNLTKKIGTTKYLNVVINTIKR